MKKVRKSFGISISFLTAFALWTAAICLIDVRQIGPQKSYVGFADINGFVHNLTGVHFNLYNITDWLGLVPIGVCIGFGALGLTQWIKRKSIRKVDFSILVLGAFYIITIAVYLLFEIVVINYRPVLIDGILESSYPSSTTLLVMCVMPTSILQFNNRIKSRPLRIVVSFVIITFTAFMVIGRLVSGVHWFTDIVGGTLFSAGIVMMYYSVNKHFQRDTNRYMSTMQQWKS